MKVAPNGPRSSSPAPAAQSFVEVLHPKKPGRPTGPAKAPGGPSRGAAPATGAPTGKPAGSAAKPAAVRPGERTGVAGAEKPPRPAPHLGTVGVQVRQAARQAARQIEASCTTDERLVRAHAASAQSQREVHCERPEDRVRTVLFREIEREAARGPEREGRPDDLRLPPPPLAEPAAGAVTATPAASAAEARTPGAAAQRAQEVAALVERIDVALKGAVPTMSLSLGERSLAATVEIARTGTREVSVRLASRGDRRALEEAGAEIQRALRARGLKLRSLTID